MVTPSQRRSMVVLNPPPGGLTVGLRPLAAAEQQLDVLQAAQVEVVGEEGLEERAGVRGGSKTRVREASTWRMDSSHQYPASRSASVSGSGMRDIHRSKNAWTVPRAEPVADLLPGIRVLAGGEPVRQRGEADPGGFACRLAHSCPQ